MTLRIEDLRCGYGKLEVLRGVSLVVPPGSVVALLGHNGAGKTTLLKTVAGLLEPIAGDVYLDGISIGATPSYSRPRQGVCLIPEGRGIFRKLTVKENIAMFVRGRAIGDAIEQAAGIFPVLGDRQHQVAGTLSGGEQQMLALSRAVLTSPSVVLADELSLGLAPVVVDSIFDVLRTLSQRQVSLLVVEQYVDRVLEIADFVYVLQKGRIAFVGEPSDCRDGNIFEQYLDAETYAQR